MSEIMSTRTARKSAKNERQVHEQPSSSNQSIQSTPQSSKSPPKKRVKKATVVEIREIPPMSDEIRPMPTDDSTIDKTYADITVENITCPYTMSGKTIETKKKRKAAYLTYEAGPKVDVESHNDVHAGQLMRRRLMIIDAYEEVYLVYNILSLWSNMYICRRISFSQGKWMS